MSNFDRCRILILANLLYLIVLAIILIFKCHPDVCLKVANSSDNMNSRELLPCSIYYKSLKLLFYTFLYSLDYVII